MENNICNEIGTTFPKKKKINKGKAKILFPSLVTVYSQ